MSPAAEASSAARTCVRRGKNGMTTIRQSNGAFSVTAYRGDAKTLLAFDFATDKAPSDLAGFTIKVTPPGVAPYYLLNDLKFADPSQHAQDTSEDAYSSINAPLHKFRWVHVLASAHQGLTPAFGNYRYTVTPRYFAGGRLVPLDASLSVTVEIEVAPYRDGPISVGFTRGFVQSQAYVRHFGPKAIIQPRGNPLQFDTTQKAGTGPDGKAFTWADQYQWLGYTARSLIFDLLKEVEENHALSLDIAAYDLNEPDFVAALLRMAPSGRVRVMLDNAALHHDAKKPKREDQFETLFAAQAGPNHIKRGRFDRYQHNKLLIVRNGGQVEKCLAGSTNFSVTGFYVNANHVVLFDDPDVATSYAGAFDEAWQDDLDAKAFTKTDWATKDHNFAAPLPPTTINYSPHQATDARRVLGTIVDRINAEEQAPEGKRSILFAVMQMTGGEDNPVYELLNNLHARQTVYSYGISDTPKGIALYQVGQKTGVLVTGKPVGTRLPPPFSQVPDIGFDHQVHHKFVVCGFNGPNPVVYFGSSNLALAGEEENGDNLIAVRDAGIATVFAIEAIALVDHFEFLNRMSTGQPQTDSPTPAVKSQAAAEAGWFLGTTDRWAAKYFDPNDLHSVDRVLFGGPPPPAGAAIPPAVHAPALLAATLAAGGPGDNEIDETVGQAIIQFVEHEARPDFSWSLIPSKDPSDGGLGVGWSAWSAMLDHLKSEYLPQLPPYSGLIIDHVLVDSTLDKNLRALKAEVVKRITLVRDHG